MENYYGPNTFECKKKRKKLLFSVLIDDVIRNMIIILRIGIRIQLLET